MKHSLKEILRISGHDAESSTEIIEFHNELQYAVSAKVEFIESICNLKVELSTKSLSEAKDAIAQIRQMQQVVYECYCFFYNIESIRKLYGDLCLSIGKQLENAESNLRKLSIYFSDNYKFCGVIK